ncbi:MAG TPA: hypothetical protein VEJ45_04270 [Candidatus Acidoferrales bacterium]|nr:hypothetical protein [Candidatus Acidoferrales bacterium]
MKALRSIALGFGLLLSTAAANAQGFDLRANIPFDFVAGNQTLPAGEYQIQSGAVSDAILMVRSSDGKRTMYLTAANCGGGNPAENTELVFHHIGKQYFLYQIQVRSHRVGRQLPISRAEAEVALNQKADNAVILRNL